MNQNFQNLKSLIEKARGKLSHVQSLDQLNLLKLEYVAGKKSLIKKLTESLQQLTADQKKEWGPKVNEAKDKIEKLIKEAEARLHSASDESDEWFDVTLPVSKSRVGHLAPDTQIIRRMNEFFTYHGYSVGEGPDIETEEFNFERTNLPQDHPARDLQDTIYIESPEVLLRTHTSSVEARLLSTLKPPLRFVVPGVSFRNEIVNVSNHAIFYQYQGVCLDKGISMANLKATLEEFAKFMYGPNVKTRFRCKYYPEVEPGAGLDVLCTFCKGGGCNICKGRGWLEILGSGMIHRNVLTKCGIDPNQWSGFAFGMGLDRIIMSKFGISDIRKLHDGELVYVDE